MAPATASPHVFRSSASYSFAVPVNATAKSPWRTSPAAEGSAFQARVFTDLREVVNQRRPPEYANTSGVQWGPAGPVVATAQNEPCSKTFCTAVDRKLMRAPCHAPLAAATGA